MQRWLLKIQNSAPVCAPVVHVGSAQTQNKQPALSRQVQTAGYYGTYTICTVQGVVVPHSNRAADSKEKSIHTHTQAHAHTYTVALTRALADIRKRVGAGRVVPLAIGHAVIHVHAWQR